MNSCYHHLLLNSHYKTCYHIDQKLEQKGQVHLIYVSHSLSMIMHADKVPACPKSPSSGYNTVQAS